MFDRCLAIIEIVLLIWIVWQGQIIVACERGVYRLQREREMERSKWREQKRQQQLKKETTPKTSDSNANLESLSPPETPSPSTKITSAKSAAARLTLTGIPVWIIFISILKSFEKLIRR